MMASIILKTKRFNSNTNDITKQVLEKAYKEAVPAGIQCRKSVIRAGENKQFIFKSG